MPYLPGQINADLTAEDTDRRRLLILAGVAASTCR